MQKQQKQYLHNLHYNNYKLIRQIMTTTKSIQKKPLELKVKDGKLSCRQRKRRSDCIPELVIDLQDERMGRNSLSNWSANYGSTLSMISQSQLQKEKQNIRNQRTVSFRNPSSLKTKHNENIKEELESLKSENQVLKNENLRLKYRIIELEENQKQAHDQKMNALKQDLESSRISQLAMEEKCIEIRGAYEEVCLKARELYQKLLQEKKWQKSLTELVLSLDCQSQFQVQLEDNTLSRPDDQFDSQVRKICADIYNMDTRERSFCSKKRRNFSRDLDI